jgi:hypothetical protein
MTAATKPSALAERLALAQYLWIVADGAVGHAERIDPQRLRGAHVDPCVTALDTIARQAGEAFLTLTGRIVGTMPITDLSTRNPAGWARAALAKAGGAQ